MSVDPELVAAAILEAMLNYSGTQFAGRQTDLEAAVRDKWPGFDTDEFQQALHILGRVGGATTSQAISDEFVRIDRAKAVGGLQSPENVNFNPRKAMPLAWEYAQFGREWLKSVWPGGHALEGGEPAFDPAVFDSGVFDTGEPAGAETELLPASNRMVPLDHNSASYREVRDGLAELQEELRASNDLECTPQERDRLLASLSSAQKLWEAAQLTILQIKVGIIITIQDTIALLTTVGKGVGKSVLIDAVKSIVKNTTGIPL